MRLRFCGSVLQGERRAEFRFNLGVEVFNTFTEVNCLLFSVPHDESTPSVREWRRQWSGNEINYRQSGHILDQEEEFTIFNNLPVSD